MKILVVEDEAELSADIVKYLSGENYVCEVASTYRLAIEKICNHAYDCIILDLMLPDGDGMDVLESAKRGQSGVLILSARNSTADKVRGLQNGADDYLSKPFHHAELTARIHAIIRRKQFGNANIVQQDEITVDLLGKAVKVGETVVGLTRKEYDLLLFFIGNKNKVVSKGALAEHLSGDMADMFDNHDFVYAHVKNLKKKLGEAGCHNHLKTIYGSGYKWEA